jgi:hypothetical protein
MKNPMHDVDREKASSISANLHYNKKFALHNPFFNKKHKEDIEIPYLDKHIIDWGQIKD